MFMRNQMNITGTLSEPQGAVEGGRERRYPNHSQVI